MTMDGRDPNAPLWASLDEASAMLARARAFDHGSITTALEAIGRLLAAGAPEDELRVRTDSILDTTGLDAARIDAALDAEEIAESLESAAAALVEELLEGAAPAADGAAGSPDRIAALLGVRDRAELSLLGAAFATGRAEDGVAAGAEGRLGFDLAVRPHAFLLVVYNEERAWRSAWIQRRYRPRFWWWFEGLSLDPRAASAMSAVAALVARSAGARGRFEALVRAEEALLGLARARAAGQAGRSGDATAGQAGRSGDATAGQAGRSGDATAGQAGRSGDATAGQAQARRADSAAGERRVRQPDRAERPAGKVVRLRDWIERRAAGGQVGLALAAAPLDEVLLLETEDAHVSWSAPGTLIVDLLSDRRAGEAPALVGADGAVSASAPVRGAEERFSFAVGAAILDGERVSLRLPLARGEVEIELPPGDVA